MPKPPPPGSPFWKLWEVFTRANVAAFRLSGGRVGGKMGRAPVLLLHHVGAKSGKHRVSPLIYVEDGDDLAIVASKGGVDKHPAWFHNLRANPEVAFGGRPFRAQVVDDEAERARLWQLADSVFPPYAVYRARAARAGRTIPIVQLVPR